MVSLQVILLVLAFVFLALAAAKVEPARVNLGALGLALWVLTLLIR